MNHVDGLLMSVLEKPAEAVRWLVLGDWLEEQGDPASLRRAELLRLQAERAGAKGDRDRQTELDHKAAAVLAEQPDLVGALQPLIDSFFPVLSAPKALAMFLLADQSSVVKGPLAARTTWEGELKQNPYSIPTILRLRKRKGNQFEGDMVEDFSSMHGVGVRGTFYFRGVIAGESHLAFVTYQTKRAGIHPGLYEFRLNRQRRLSGTWKVPSWEMAGKMWLKQKQT